MKLPIHRFAAAFKPYGRISGFPQSIETKQARSIALKQARA
jgi:hypothetical protein